MNTVQRFLLLFLIAELFFGRVAMAEEQSLVNNSLLDFRIQDPANDPNQALPPYRFSLQGYEPVSFSNLFRLYWKAGIVKPDNRDALAEYLESCECQIYKSTFNNDFLWPDVLKTTSAYIQKNKKKFSSQFTFIQPVAIDRYDPYKEWFSITPDTQYLNATTMTFAQYDMVRTECDPYLGFYPRIVPKTATIKFTQPFSLTYLKMKPDFAEQYIKYMDRKKEDLEILGIRRSRFAYIQFYITATGLDAAKSNESTANFLGILDGFIVYADKDLTKPLYDWVNQKKEADGAPDPAASISFTID